MIKYLNFLENRKKYYLPLINFNDDGEKKLYQCSVPISFFLKYEQLFNTSKILINTYKTFDINRWYEEHKRTNYEFALSVFDEYIDIKEDFDWTIADVNRINSYSNDFIDYFYLIEKVLKLFTKLFPTQAIHYQEMNLNLKKALIELQKLSTITYSPQIRDNVYLPDAWFITPDGQPYNPGDEGHSGRDLLYSYQNLKENVKTINSNTLKKYKKKLLELKKTTNEIQSNQYITSYQFRNFLNYISQPAYLDSVNGFPVTREKHIVEIVSGIAMAHLYFYEFFYDLMSYTTNPKVELEKIINLTNNNLLDILVRCCGFHKVETSIPKTITTSCINYERVFEEYIKKGWSIAFIPPIIINKEKKEIEQYPNEFLVIRKILKK